ncbi:MAG: TolC family protein [Candidatus Krumholzibacteriota bacterium]|nr:TolC family protein [Candidatus Krumholzibacteriota bacterium]
MRVFPAGYRAVLLIAFLIPASSGAFERDEARDMMKAVEAGFASASPAGPGNTLEDYLAYAALNNPGLRAAFYRWKSRLEGIDAESSLADPVFSYSYFIENIETRVGPQNQRFGIRQKFPWFGTLGAKRDMAAESAAGLYQAYLSEKLSLFLRVKEAYYDCYLLRREREIIEAGAGLLAQIDAVSRTRYETSSRRYSDLVRLEIESSLLEERLISLGDREKAASAKLRASLDLPGTAEIEVSDSIARFTPSLDFETVKNDILANNPDLKALGHMIGREKAALSLARRERWPDLTIGFDYIETGDAIDPTMPGSGKDPWSVNFAVELPIWHGKNSSRGKEALAGIEMTRYLLRDRKNSLVALAEEVFSEYIEAGRDIDLYGNDLIAKAEHLLIVTFEEYKTGTADFSELVDAQRQLLDLRLEREKAMVVEAKKLALIEMLTGKELMQGSD